MIPFSKDIRRAHYRLRLKKFVCVKKILYFNKEKEKCIEERRFNNGKNIFKEKRKHWYFFFVVL